MTHLVETYKAELDAIRFAPILSTFQACHRELCAPQSSSSIMGSEASELLSEGPLGGGQRARPRDTWLGVDRDEEVYFSSGYDDGEEVEGEEEEVEAEEGREEAIMETGGPAGRKDRISGEKEGAVAGAFQGGTEAPVTAEGQRPLPKHGVAATAPISYEDDVNGGLNCKDRPSAGEGMSALEGAMLSSSVKADETDIPAQVATIWQEQVDDRNKRMKF